MTGEQPRRAGAPGVANGDPGTPEPDEAKVEEGTRPVAPEPHPSVETDATGAAAPPAEEGEEPAGASVDAASRLEAERDRYLDGLQRLKAEFDNYRKRSERERQAQAAGAVRDFVASLLPVVDNLERAVAALGEEGSEIFTGVDMVRQQLTDVLEGRGVTPIDAHGEAFDPHYHEAVATLPSGEHPEGTVVEVVQKGYAHGDAVIRPSRVVVSTRP